VDSVLEGSVRKAGDRLRVTVQLIDVRTDGHRWAQTYDRRLEDVFAIQTEIAESTARALEVELLRPEREALQARPTSNLAAYEAYLRGLKASQGFDFRKELDLQAVEYYEAAIRLDPQFAAAYAALANHLFKVEGITRAAAEVFPRAQDLVGKALELDPDSSDAHTACGNLAMQADLDWTRAESEFRRAISLNPSNSAAHLWFSLLLVSLQRYDEAKQQVDSAIDLDPLYLTARECRIGLAEAVRDWEWATREAEGLAATFHTSSYEITRCQLILAWLYAYTGRTEDARKIVESWSAEIHPLARPTRAALLAYLGDPRELRASLNEFVVQMRSEYRWDDFEFFAWAVLGEKERALTLLEERFRNGERFLWNSYQAPYYDALRDDPRFVGALRAMNIPTGTPWAQKGRTGPAHS
jgi:serine/threonine-protein kinase